ncbi:16S rRNA (guanine(966)-N(2))-methyltransferase RsmD [Bengtsoniella intestinalis]|uniref:16S rRNA (guanine(966)-N(2))-methyltransferase RsmD n=1 Tax=Bengtsoniella intestinalis TaxID=3073143 RepID=UPI00391F0BD3
MRVISGIARGRRLKQLEGMETRPTTDRVKEAMFSILQFDIEGRRVLDLFAGTGQLGIEALSRGAKSCVFVERRKDALVLIQDNLKATDLAEHASVVAGESLEYVKKRRHQFDLVLLDPPYQGDLLENAILSIELFDILAPHGIIVAEHPAGATLPALQAPYVLHRTYRYGQIGLSVYHRSGEEV